MIIKFKLPKGKWTPMEVDDRHHLNHLRNGILKGAKVKIIGEPEPNTNLQNKPMQRICGV